MPSGLAIVITASVLALTTPGAAGAREAEELRLYVLDCGTLVVADPAPFALSKDEVSTLELSVPCFLVEHPQGTLLWDAGLPDALAAHPEGTRQGSSLLYLEQTLESQLEALGHPAAAVSHVAFSHLHFDHSGNGNLFAGATWLVQGPELDVAFSSNPDEPPYFDPSAYAELEQAETVRLDGDHDVFGDGHVLIVSAPGHTPGHQVLLVDLAEHGPVVLSGDLYHFPESRALRRVPTFNTDLEASRASMERVEALLVERGAELWIEHDSVQNARLRKAPGYYR